MGSIAVVPAVPGDAAAVTEVIPALETSLYPEASGSFSQDDLEDEWSGLDLVQNARVVRDGERILAYGAVRDRGELWRVEGYVHPDAHGRGIGKLIATGLERDAARPRCARIQNGVYETDAAARSLLESIGYDSVRVFREMRIDLDAPPPAPVWPDGLQAGAFDPDRDALMFHAAQEEAFADHWEHIPRDLEWWSKSHLTSGRFDPALWCVVRAGDEIAAGTICTADTTVAASSRSSSPVGRGASKASGRRSSRTRSAGSGSGASAASGLASTRRVTLARFASTSVPE